MTTWHRDCGVLHRRSGARRILACPGADELVVVDGVGSVIWDRLAEPVDDHRLVSELAEAFETPSATVRREVTAFLARLDDLGAVRCR